MSAYLAQAIAAQRKVENSEPLDSIDVAIIKSGLRLIICNQRNPFERYRDHFIIGTERFKVVSGLDYFRTILMYRKSSVWYSDSNISQLGIYQVYTASQVEPPQPYNYDPDRGTPEEYAEELGNRSHIGPTYSGSFQEEFDSTAIESLRQYVRELGEIDTTTALEKREELEAYLSKSASQSEPGDLSDAAELFIRNHRFRGMPRTLNSPKKQIADIVRQATKYALNEVLRKNPMTVDIADHLEQHIKIGQVCEYRGDWKWKF